MVGQNRCQRNVSFIEQKNIASQWPKKCLIHQTRNISSRWPNQRNNQKHVLVINMSSNWIDKKKMCLRHYGKTLL